jgi:hypothetical protein
MGLRIRFDSSLTAKFLSAFALNANRTGDPVYNLKQQWFQADGILYSNLYKVPNHCVLVISDNYNKIYTKEKIILLYGLDLHSKTAIDIQANTARYSKRI